MNWFGGDDVRMNGRVADITGSRGKLDAIALLDELNREQDRTGTKRRAGPYSLDKVNHYESEPGFTYWVDANQRRIATSDPSIFLHMEKVTSREEYHQNYEADSVRARWFGLDDFDDAPRLAVWAIATQDMHATLPQLPGAVGRAVPITRGDLSWLISVPDDGSLPFDGAFPTIIEWPEGSPASRMANPGCSLLSLVIGHTQADAIGDMLAGRLDDLRVSFSVKSRTRIIAEIETPHGVRVLS